MVVDCTTVARVKALLTIGAADTDNDTVLGNYITSTSARIEQWLGRPLLATTYTDEIDIESPRTESVFLRAYPVTSVTSVKNDPEWDWAGVEAIDSDLYHLTSGTGQLDFNVQLTPGKKALQVVYAGGLVADTAAMLANYPAIAAACEVQVAAAFRRRTSPQGESVHAGGGSIAHEGPLRFVPDALEALWPYRRLRF